MKSKKKGVLIFSIIIIFIISIISGYVLSNKIFSKSTQKPKFNYNTNINMSYIQKDSISYKIDYISLEDDKLEFVFNFYFSEDVSNFEGVSLSEFTIEDENGIQIYKGEESSLSYSIESSNIEVNKNTIKQLYRFKLKEKINSKTILMNFKKIILYNVNKGNPITKEISGNWDLKVNLK